MLKRLLITTMLLFTVAISQPLSTEGFSIAEGLSDSRVHYILQDRYGLLWIATAGGGLNMYDGYSFKVFKSVPGNPNSILNNEIHGLIEDKDGNIWVAVNKGVSKYIRSKNIFVNYDFEELFPDEKDLLSNSLLFTLDENNDLWLTTTGTGIMHYDHKLDKWSLLKFKSPDGIVNLANRFAISGSFDQQGRLWTCVDGLGFMWFDKSDSLFKPASFANPDKAPDFSKVENMITYILKDPTGILWITTRMGVYKFNTETDEIKTLIEYKTQGLNFWTYFNRIVQDNKGNIWIANNLRGMLKFDGISDEFEMIKFTGQNFTKDRLSDIRFTNVFFDQSGIMWMGTVAQGLLKHDPQRVAFKHYVHQPNNPNSLSGSQVFGLYESDKNKGKIYVGLRGAGLNLFDPVTETFRKIPLTFVYDTFGGSVRTIREQNDGTLLLGTWGDGLYHVNANGTMIAQFITDSSKTNSLPDNLVRILEKDLKGNYWVGTNAGLCYYNTQKNTIKRISNPDQRVYPQGLLDLIKQKFKADETPIQLDKVGNNANSTIDFKVTRPRNYLILSTGEGAFESPELADNGWISDSEGKEIWNGKNGNETYYLGGDTKNRIKIDMQEFKPGNYKLHFKSDLSHSYDKWNAQPPAYLNLWGIRIVELNDPSEIKRIQNFLDEAGQQLLIAGTNIRSVHVRKDGVVWIGSDTKGLNRLDPVTGIVKNYAADPNKENTLSDNSVQFIHEDADGILWLATNGGLNRFDPQAEQFTNFSEEDGLPTNYVASILPGVNGSLWLATRSGLSKMIQSTSTGKITFVNYDANDGLGGTSFVAQVALKSRAGRYYFGGEHGLDVFSEASENEAPPELYLSDFSVSNVSLLSTKSEIEVDTTLTEIKDLELPYDKNDLTFAYSALHFSNPAKNQYAHMLEGYDIEWIYDNQRTATYTNMDPGDYVFSFKGSNRDGVWNEKGKSIAITILAPWWMTVWAYIGYVLIFAGIIFGVDRFQRRRLLAKEKERSQLREAELRAETAELKVKAADAERRALQAENERKSKELEEARQLQLSMLPKKLPQLPNLDIAVYMQTATEVGGDYYDFHVGLDGTLTVVIGDATGHGMKAGTMVTTAKSLFNSYAPNPDILFTFSEITRCIKQMNFGKLSMCLTMVKIKGDRLQISTAGMPPSFIFRRDTRVVEEHLFKAMPLGSMEKFPYELKDTTLKPGDTILLMSDGLPELENDDGEMYGYKKIRNGFEDVAEKSPEDIISYLKE